MVKIVGVLLILGLLVILSVKTYMILFNGNLEYDNCLKFASESEDKRYKPIFEINQNQYESCKLLGVEISADVIK